MYYQPDLHENELDDFRHSMQTLYKDQAQEMYALHVGRLQELRDAGVPFTDRRFQDVLYLIRFAQFKASMAIGKLGRNSATAVYIILAGNILSCLDWLERNEEEREAISPYLQADLAIRTQELSASSPGGRGISFSILKADTRKRIVQNIKSPLVLSKVLAAIELVGNTAVRTEDLFFPSLPASWCKCFQCRKDIKELKRCGGCKVTLYCSTECQKKSWLDSHKTDCRRNRKLLTPYVEAAEMGASSQQK